MPRRFALLLLALFALAAAGWFAWDRSRPEPPAPAGPDTTATGLKAVTLWFAAPDGERLVSESRDLPEGAALHERVATLVEALARGPSGRGVGAVPAGTAVLHAYVDDAGLLTLDLSRSFRLGFRGGSRAEDLALGSLVRTLAANLPEVKRVRIVCNGAALASLGGHFPLDRPLDPQDWY